MLLLYAEYELGGETLGEPTLEVGADCDMLGREEGGISTLETAWSCT